jgi:hypothetical protein
VTGWEALGVYGYPGCYDGDLFRSRCRGLPNYRIPPNRLLGRSV